MTPRRHLVLGGAGQVGTAMRDLCTARELVVAAPTRTELDLTDFAALSRYIEAYAPDVIFNCAAYTAVDRAESEPEAAWLLNATLPTLLAQIAAQRGIILVHLSTDYVFNGEKQAPYTEADATDPQNTYGRSKLAGEVGIFEAAPRGVVLRTAWVVSPWRNNFVKTMLRLGAEREELAVVGDQYGNPTSAVDIAEAMLCTAESEIVSRQPMRIYHFVNAGGASWFELASFVFEQAGDAGHRVPRVKPISSAEYITPVVRPKNSRLDTTQFARDFGFVPRHWKEAVAQVVESLI